jgi:putative DNA primase/helicase
MKQMKRRYNLHVCFSAGNMVKVAATLEPGLVIADNDESGTGERVAKEIGWPYWISDKVGEDANDYHQRLGLFAFTQSLTSMLGRSIKSLSH